MFHGMCYSAIGTVYAGTGSLVEVPVSELFFTHKDVYKYFLNRWYTVPILLNYLECENEMTILNHMLVYANTF